VPDDSTACRFSLLTCFDNSAGLPYFSSGNSSSTEITSSLAAFEPAVSINVCLSAGYKIPFNAF